MSAAVYRRLLIERLIASLLPLEPVRACFEGGSAATGRLDDFSDVDLVIVAPLAASETVFNAVEAALSTSTAITHRWPVEPPSFPDIAQRFYFLADAPRFFAVDCVVATEASVTQFLECERHGEPLLYFDRTGTIRARPVDQPSLAVRRAHRWRQLRGAVPVYAMLVDKELARNRPLEAMGFYQTLLRALLEVLGVEHRPDRFDFGWRYVESQMPEDARRLIAHFAFVGDPETLRERAPELAAELARRLTAPSR
ncbi:MAG: hypothetical protein OEU89_02100 [Burkholderiaceae bacterium]|jgi:hypothetical protein|nr:hypothetical protein [Burkholderiaceae bacterium]